MGIAHETSQSGLIAISVHTPGELFKFDVLRYSTTSTAGCIYGDQLVPASTTAVACWVTAHTFCPERDWNNRSLCDLVRNT